MQFVWILFYLVAVGWASIQNGVISAMLAYQAYTTSHYPGISVTVGNHTEFIGGVFCLQVTEDGSSIEDAEDQRVFINQKPEGVLVTYIQDENIFHGFLTNVTFMNDILFDTPYQADEMEVTFHEGRP